MATLESSAAAQETTDATIVFSNFSAPTGCGLVLSIICSAPSKAISSVTYNGATWTEVSDIVDDGIGINELFVYMTHQGADGSGHDLTVTFDSAMSGEVGHAIVSAWSGVDVSSTAAMHRTIYTDGTGSGDLNVTATDSQNGDTVVHCIGNWGTDIALVETAVASSPYVGIFSGSYDHAQQYKTATGSSTAMTVTGGQYGIAAAFALIPSSGGPGSGSDSGKIGLSDESSNLIRVSIIEETS